VRAALLVVALLTACGVPPEAIEQARREQAVALGITLAADASPDLKAYGVVEYDAWSAQRYALDGVRLPQATEDRMRAAGTLPEGYGR
jgi:hypothetical protein